MRRAVKVLGSLIAAGALTLGLSGSAWASQGTLTVSGKTYTDPGRGCYTGDFWPLAVNNRTDTVVFVYEDEDCEGRRIGRVLAGDNRVFDLGNSVGVPR
ncbi:hypothetical protein [Streptomyces sp. NBC_01506]|uniref:hypothetical protein n=1 Tax=Streptomyces sp. NBC_01506 TaxID=2903887 RepID=UPI00386F162D